MTADKRDDIDRKTEINMLASFLINNDHYQRNSISLAAAIIDGGWIPRERAVEYCSVCKQCKGRGWDIIRPISKEDIHAICPTCKGRGIVLKESK